MTERLELLIDARRIRARVTALARRIDADRDGRPLCLVVVLKGAAVFAADLLRCLGDAVTLDFVAASSYGAATRSSGNVILDGLGRLDLAGRDVLVVEDILDTGRTCTALLDHLRRQRPKRLELCALLRKPQARGLALPVRYVGFDIADDFVVGYGMDYAGRYRNLRGIHRLVLDGEPSRAPVNV